MLKKQVFVIPLVLIWLFVAHFFVRQMQVMFRVSDETKSVPVNKKMRPCNWLKVAAKGK